ncbi:DUF6266 family protein [Halosquirtibacter xylanolyticus]|uniref:DUF6266 family protein n=1 Tax=Halosquirtibacter xylanolyticus TaxID=3374599 RepID=UPI003749696D|nr:DUF6266 family protein [Prolixibacteraceae bacterium]
MGSIRKGVLGGFNGKVGSVIGSRWKGNYFMRSLPDMPKSKKVSMKALQHRACFKQTSRFISKARRLVEIGFFPEKDAQTVYNAAFESNHGCFQYQDDHVEVDYSSLKLSNGALCQMGDFTLDLKEDGLLEITWSDVELDRMDEEPLYVHLLICRDDMKYMRSYVSLAKATELSAELMITSQMAGHKLHVYAFYGLRRSTTLATISDTTYCMLQA